MEPLEISEILDNFSIEAFLNSALRLRLSDLLQATNDELLGEESEEQESVSQQFKIREIANRPIKKACIVGTVVSIENFGNDVVFYIDDGTERALVRQTSKNDQPWQKNTITQWQAVKVIGNISIQHNPLSETDDIVIDAEIIRPLETDMEEFVHRLDAVRTRFTIKKINERQRLQAKTEQQLKTTNITDRNGNPVVLDDLIEIVKEIIRNLDINQRGTSFDEILEELTNQGYQITEEALDEIILDLMDRGELFEPRAGYYQLVY